MKRKYIEQAAAALAAMRAEAQRLANAGHLQLADLSIIKAAQKAVIEADRPGRSVDDVERDVRRVMASLRVQHA